MKFKANTRRRALEYEKALVQTWKEEKAFEKSVEQRSAENAYVFYDGPPFITGNPHHGTLLPSIVKDAVPRYWTMKGKRVERVWGWDCHGLPAETFTEKKLGITDRQDIGTKISLEDYILTCRENMVQTGSEWEDTIDRVGRWVDFGGAYKTMDKPFMESVWWAFKTLHDKGKIYEGEKVLMYCTRDATPLSKAEVTMDAGAYQDVTDPSAYVKFKLTDENASLLAWTTTPWTLSANTALAVNPAANYAKVKVGADIFYLASELVEKVMLDDKKQAIEHEIVDVVSGAELVGRYYEPLLPDEIDPTHPQQANAYKVWGADFVTMEDGTGIVHIAPAFGEDDHALSREHKIPLLMTIDASGQYLRGDWQGKLVWDVNKEIAKTLLEQGKVWRIQYVRHSYPHCYRCNTRLMYRAHPSWFMDIANQRDEMLAKNEDIEWFPDHLKHGRFAKTVESAPDWNLSRDRFWATPMPVWKGTDADGREHVKVLGSFGELEELTGQTLEDYHRPWIDDLKFTIDGVEYTRIEKVMDCWFESGSMPFAQFHYPFENKEKFEANFPGDFVVEYVGQVRAWFYYMHAVSVGIFGQAPFKHVVTTGIIAGNDGRKMSKSYGNYTDPNELMDQFSADSLRFLLLQSPLLNGEDFALQDKEVGDVARKLTMIWNMYDFFTMYADVDGWEWHGELDDPLDTLTHPLDRWVVSRLHQLQAEVDEHMQAYNLPSAMKPVLPFIEDASNWFVRRSRKRFWKSESDSDKHDAYRTLHYVLTRLSMILAPFTPFLADELYRQMTGSERSVHLLDWPEQGKIDDAVLEEMALTRKIIELGLAQRMLKNDTQEQVKVRQPLAKLQYAGAKVGEFYEAIIAEEVNVKRVEHSASLTSEVALDKAITPELKREGLMREVVRAVQNARKKAGLNVDDRIVLSLVTGEEDLRRAIDEYDEVIAREVLAAQITTERSSYTYTDEVVIDGLRMVLSLQRQV